MFLLSPHVHGSLNSMCYLPQIGAKDYTYTVQAITAMKQTRKNRLPSHKVLQVEQWERHVNTSLPCDVIQAIGVTHKSQSSSEEGVAIPSAQARNDCTVDVTSEQC